QVRALEEALGHPLFRRQGRSVEPTAAGRQLQESCQAAFAQLRDGWSRLRQAQAGAALVLGCPGSVLARWVIPRLERLRHALPDLRLHLAAQEDSDALAGVDAALLLVTPPWPAAWQVHDLAPECIGPVLSPRHPEVDRLRALPAAALGEE